MHFGVYCNTMYRDESESAEVEELKQRIGKMYFFWISLVFGITAYIFPYIMDYYVLRPRDSFFSFYEFHIVGNMNFLHISLLLILFITLIIYAVSLRADVSLGITLLAMCVLSYASHIKYTARNEMISYRDIFVTDAGHLAKEYMAWDFTSYFALLILFALVMTALLTAIELVSKDYKKAKTARFKWIFRGCCMVIGLIGMIFVIPYMNAHAVSLASQTQGVLSEKKYDNVIYNFIRRDSYDLSDIDVDKAIAELVEAAAPFETKTLSDEKTNIIVIMNESWWDISPLLTDQIVCSKDPMESFDQLKEKAVSGRVAVNIFGGGTIASEVEFLMGLNMKYFSSTVGIANYLEDRAHNPSIVDYFNDLDYNTIAIHPFTGEFYNRETIYETYGFDKSVFEDDMKYISRFDDYISDDALADQIIYEYENTDHLNPSFIWAVSMASHAPGMGAGMDDLPEGTYPIDVSYNTDKLDDSEKKSISRTINSFYLSCKAYEKLTNYFENKNERTLILMYGDHCPGISEELYDLLGYDNIINNSDQIYDLYTTPVLLWSNFETESDIKSFDADNIQYLPSAILDYAGMRQCTMTKIALYINSVINTNSVKLVLDKDKKPIGGFDDIQSKIYMDFGAFQNDICFENSDYLWIYKMLTMN